ncbi:uncharacterized protein M6B38_266560 [Iris pallida]|uniref:U1-type domain-containing protein n=1 Tax=Iris pallida TaxID=29817 RepID=A0AAX6I8T7_IRIPA|nr:uncharacterized protein M6B38_266560 [Iris pallida]
MEFRPRSGDEERFRSFEPSPPPPPHPFSGNGYFSFQAMGGTETLFHSLQFLENFLRPKLWTSAASLFVAGFVDRPRNSLEALEMELREERLREEIIARRVAQRRMIEEQARREMEIAVAMGMGGGGGLLCHPQPMMEPPEEVEFGERRRFSPRLGRRCMPEGPEDIDFRRRVVEFEERSRFGPLHGGRDVEADGRAPRELREVEVGKKLASWSNKPEVKTTTTETIAPTLAGAKRKPVAAISGTSGSKFPRPAQKVWSCALCQVSATSEEGLNEHLQGRKHVAKVAQLSSKKNFTVTALAKDSGTGSGSAWKPNVAAKKNPAAKVTRKVSIKVNEKVHEVVEKGRFLWCWMCRVKCNDQSAMIAHLSGKRHLLEDSNKRTAIYAGTPQKKEVVEDDKKECTEEAAQYAVNETKKELTEEAEQCAGSEDKKGFKNEAEQLGRASADMVVVED